MSMSSGSRVRVIVNTEFACIPIAVIHNNMYEYRGYLEIRAVFVYSSSLRMKTAKIAAGKFDVKVSHYQ